MCGLSRRKCRGSHEVVSCRITPRDTVLHSVTSHWPHVPCPAQCSLYTSDQVPYVVCRDPAPLCSARDSSGQTHRNIRTKYRVAFNQFWPLLPTDSGYFGRLLSIEEPPWPNMSSCLCGYLLCVRRNLRGTPILMLSLPSTRPGEAGTSASAEEMSRS